MTDKIAETVARLLRQSEQAYALADTAQNSLSWRLEARGALLRISKAGYDAADLLKALARDLAAARDRADHAWQRVAEADSAAIKAAAESLQHMLDKQAAEARVATLEASLSGGVLTKNDSLDLLQKLAAAEADRDRLATELAEARTVQAAAGVLLDHAVKTCGAEEPEWQPVFEAMEPHGFNDKWDNAQVLIAALRALAVREK